MKRAKTRTPGKWSISPENPTIVLGEDDHAVARCIDPNRGLSQSRANALLCATAPELLHELECLVENVACGELPDRNQINGVRELIAKAKGETP